MYTGLLHTHTLVVTLYLILLLIKTILLFAGKKDKLATFREKTKIPEMVLATLFLLTGIVLGFMSGSVGGAWFIVKVILILAIIGSGVMAFKKESRILALLSLVFYLYVFGISETKSLTFNTDYQALYGVQTVDKKDWDASEPDYSLKEHGKVVYEQNCIGCHGPEGNLNKSGANSLDESQLKLAGIKDMVRNGKNAMPAFESILSKQEVKAVSHYVEKSLMKEEDE